MELDEEGQPIYDPEDDVQEEEWQQPAAEEDWPQEEQEPRKSPSAHSSDAEDKPSKPRKRLVKKSAEEESRRAKYREKTRSSDKSRMLKTGGKDREMNEMWNSVAGDSEDDNEGQKTNDDTNFIDDTGVEPAERFVGSEDEAGSAGDAPQAEEGEEDDDELKRVFKTGKKRKNTALTDQEIEEIVTNFMEKLDAAFIEDAELNRKSKPAISKLKLLPSLVRMLQKRSLQNEFLDRGVLTQLKNWLEPLPDGSLPNMNIRSAILKLLTELPIDLEQEDRREQLKQSGLGKVVMFLSKLEEETTANKKLAKDLVDKWSRPLFQKSTRYESLRNYDEERPAPRRPPPKKQARRDAADEDDMLEEGLETRKSGKAARTTRPEAVAMDFVVRPQSKVDMQAIQSQKQNVKDQTKRQKMSKKLQQRAPKKKLQAQRISVEGRGLTRL